ncbi:MAG: beta-lactamase family protein [Lachnospiraceae bacterium]|jgi:CubicO group peptidase (beta-lactamase class C family)|nr:beta-lactamase family protein [Lachnospiraceae bacterium]
MASSLSHAEALLEQGLRDRVYSGAALAIGNAEQVFVSHTVGHVSYEENAAPITSSTLFDMASISKILGTTFCAFHMIEEGRLCLQDSLADFFSDVPEDKQDITIYHLMTHTSGLPAELFLWKLCQTPEQVVSAILNAPLDFPIGSNIQYSCMGYILLGKIMEGITGRSLDQLAKEWTFDPLGMRATGYRPVSACSPDPSIAYTETMTLSGPGLPGVVHDENARFLNGISGNAGVFSNLDDMILFAQMLSQKGKPLISRRLMELACRNYTPGLDENRGLGFQLSGPAPTFFGDLFGNDGIGHTGYTGTSLAVDPHSGLYVVLLTNRVHPTRDNAGLTRLRHQIHNAAVAEFLH